jgi:hypothetical protein
VPDVEDYDRSIHSNPDAMAWAEFFVRTHAEHPGIASDPGTMVGWFANAMQAAVDATADRHRAGP